MIATKARTRFALAAKSFGFVGSVASLGCSAAAPTAPRAISTEQLAVMFEMAVAQQRPFNEQKAMCIGLQSIADRQMRDAPASMVRRVAASLRMPAYPASSCGLDIVPFVKATGAKAMLYTVKIDNLTANGSVTFMATATCGNLGANGRQFRLVRSQGRWVARPTGLQVLS